MDKIVEAIPLEDYKIKIVTGSGITGTFNVKPYLNGSAFQELKDIDYFKLVKASKYGIEWSHEQDFSSDTIVYDIKSCMKEFI